MTLFWDRPSGRVLCQRAEDFCEKQDREMSRIYEKAIPPKKYETRETKRGGDSDEGKEKND